MEGGGGVRKNEKKNKNKGRLTPERNKRMRPPARLAARSRTAMAAATDGQAPFTSEACTPVQPRRRRAPPPPRPSPQPRPRPDHFVALQCSASVADPAFATPPGAPPDAPPPAPFSLAVFAGPVTARAAFAAAGAGHYWDLGLAAAGGASAALPAVAGGGGGGP